MKNEGAEGINALDFFCKYCVCFKLDLQSTTKTKTHNKLRVTSSLLLCKKKLTFTGPAIRNYNKIQLNDCLPF